MLGLQKTRLIRTHIALLALTVSSAVLHAETNVGVAPLPTPPEAGMPAPAPDLAAVPPASHIPTPEPSSPHFDISQGFSSIVDKALKAVVNVSTTQVLEGKGEKGHGSMPQLPPGSPFEELFREFFDQMERPRKVQSLGSGFIVRSSEASAFIVTNYHVIADAKKVSIILNDGTELEATVHSFDDRTDIAVLEIKTDGLPPAQRKLPSLEWGASHTAKVGDWILAIGNPFGLGSTVTNGIISNRARDISVSRGNGSRGRASDYIDDFIQHSASINMGNSGGPLLNLKGEVIGINAAILSPSGGNIGIGFAVPADVAKQTVDQLIDLGRTRRAWLGVRIQPVTDDMSESLGLGKARGAIVGSVTPDGPAAKANLQPGDIILEFDGKEINEKAKLTRIVGESPIGKPAKVKILRKGKEVIIDIVPGEFETSPDKSTHPAADKSKAVVQDGFEVLGIKLSLITPELRDRYKINKDAKGVVIVSVAVDSTAAEIGLRPGDVIVEANQKEVTKPEDFGKIIEEAKKEKRKNVLLFVTRGEDPRYLPLNIEEEEKGGKLFYGSDSKVDPKKEPEKKVESEKK